MDMGHAVISVPGGIKKLLEALETDIRTNREAEGEAFYKLGGKTQTHGRLSRQPGEPMTSYISRRKRWWRRAKSLDSEMVITDRELAKQFLQCANTSEDHILMMVGEDRKKEHCKDVGRPADELVEDHGRIHEK